MLVCEVTAEDVRLIRSIRWHNNAGERVVRETMETGLSVIFSATEFGRLEWPL